MVLFIDDICGENIGEFGVEAGSVPIHLDEIGMLANTVLLRVVLYEVQCIPFCIRENHLRAHLTRDNTCQSKPAANLKYLCISELCADFLYIKRETNRGFPEVGPIREIEFTFLVLSTELIKKPVGFLYDCELDPAGFQLDDGTR